MRFKILTPPNVGHTVYAKFMFLQLAIDLILAPKVSP